MKKLLLALFLTLAGNLCCASEQSIFKTESDWLNNKQKATNENDALKESFNDFGINTTDMRNPSEQIHSIKKKIAESKDPVVKQQGIDLLKKYKETFPIESTTNNKQIENLNHQSLHQDIDAFTTKTNQRWMDKRVWNMNLDQLSDWAKFKISNKISDWTGKKPTWGQPTPWSNAMHNAVDSLTDALNTVKYEQNGYPYNQKETTDIINQITEKSETELQNLNKRFQNLYGSTTEGQSGTRIDIKDAYLAARKKYEKILTQEAKNKLWDKINSARTMFIKKVEFNEMYDTAINKLLQENPIDDFQND